MRKLKMFFLRNSRFRLQFCRSKLRMKVLPILKKYHINKHFMYLTSKTFLLRMLSVAYFRNSITKISIISSFSYLWRIWINHNIKAHTFFATVTLVRMCYKFLTSISEMDTLSSIYFFVNTFWHSLLYLDMTAIGSKRLILVSSRTKWNTTISMYLLKRTFQVT